MHASSRGSHQDVALSLCTLAFLSIRRPTASALEVAAGHLLSNLMALQVPLDEPLTAKSRKNFTNYAIQAAHDLFELTERPIPGWLPAPPPAEPEINEEEAQVPAPQSHSQSRVSKPPAPPPGINLSTEDAAQLLNRRPQTLRGWASKDSGPMRPVRSGRFLQWPSDELLRLMKDGWR